MRTLLVLAVAGCTSTSAAPPPGRTFSDAAYTDHIDALRSRLRSLGLGHLDVHIEDPFVVVGDGTPGELARNARTVRWAADTLEQDFFAKRPTTILDVYLFRSAASYENGVKKLTGESPTTPYGFYSRSDRGLFMNIATGGGTLIHEIVHPFVEADFPAAPAWLNEGLGSLFEQSDERDGHIVGLTNWRLAGLQQAIAADVVPSFRKLTSLSAAEFYSFNSGLHYAQARYLLYYLQEQGVLRDFYKAFRAAAADDPTGYSTLVKTLGERDMIDFQIRWQRYVQRLRFE